MSDTLRVHPGLDQPPLGPALASTLGPGESDAIALGLENPSRVILLDDQLARQVAKDAGLDVWGTLRLLLEAKLQGIVDQIAPLVDQLAASGMWLSDDIRARILRLAGEDEV
jgi:predicted nucleic acid-binding protein